MAQNVNVLFISPEVDPFAKTGGLADVSAALPKAIKKQNCQARIIMPYYAACKGKVGDVETNSMRIARRLGNYDFTAEFLEGTLGRTSIPITFVRCDPLFDRPGLYGDAHADFPDNLLRFSFFSHVALHYANQLPDPPNVVHCNDWQTGLIPALLQAYPDTFDRIRHAMRVMTIHNLSFQGVFTADQFHLTGLPDRFNTMDGMEYYGKFSLLKSGVVYSDLITTVSQKYAEEIQTREHGNGFDEILTNRRDRLVGIMNGVDYSVWNPGRDRYLAAPYSAQEPAGKAVCRRDLLETLGLDPAFHGPVIGMVCRLTGQKGLDLVTDAADRMLQRGVAFVVLGTGEHRFEERLRDLMHRYPHQVAVRLEYNEAIAHKIEAGADLFLMPSRFEPSGLNQLYSLAYGTVPLVRATGGLDDSIEQYHLSSETGNGFKFHDYTVEALLERLDQALDVYFHHRDAWNRLVEHIMTLDYSWKTAAKQYISLYREGLHRKDGD